ncbi:WASH complex subunit 1 [Sabethes cyaneus]|uniref:WASH complex subunit 1 n=1 Tax=Sabethes cyaneus TaxID=53552 RepID=UPI00237EC027|nr:WASH complex subunit 1 [Sabethes cyaneus]
MFCYNIPTIDPDLRHEETILNAINVFEFLNEVIEDVFGKVNQRIEKNRQRLRQIDARIEKVNSSVARLKDTKEAIVIYSPCRYPGADLDTTVLPTFTNQNGIRMRENEFTLRDRPYVPAHSYQEKIQFYHVKSPSDRHRIFSFDNPRRNRSEERVKFVDSILMFNSREFAIEYKGIADKSREGRKAAGQIREEKILSSSSPIIRTRSRKKGQEIFYTPRLNEAPKIDVPVDLPDLPGIVTNIQYAGSNTLIAPSLQLAAIADQLPELEDLVDIGQTEVTSTTPDMIQTIVSTKIESPAIASSVQLPPAPPPPPPPPPPLELYEQSFVEDKNPDSKDDKPTEKRQPPVSTPADAHFNLMEAIRKAGGAQNAKLKHSQPADGKRDSTKPSKTGPQNFIDDLHNKLQMRRKGISGARENQEPGNVIDRLSALIPPPPPKLDASASESNDEDWD